MTTINQKYHLQASHARKRGIEWHFTYQSWLEWWGEDLDKRGQKANDLCMARYNDDGPYHPDNVFKCTQRQNKIDAHKFNPRTPWNKGMGQ